MAKIALVRNEHVNEAVAHSMAPEIAKELRVRGHEVAVFKMPFKKTVWGELTRRKKLPESSSELEYLLGTNLPVHKETIAKLAGQGFAVRRLHNCPYPNREPYLLERGIVEIPAVYKPTRNKSFREAASHFKKIASQQAKLALKGTRGILGARALFQHYYFVPRWYLQNQADVAESRKRGLMSSERVKKIADLIEKSLKKE